MLVQQQNVQNVFACAEMDRTNIRPNADECFKSLLISVKQELLSIFEDTIKTWQDHQERLFHTVCTYQSARETAWNLPGFALF